MTTRTLTVRSMADALGLSGSAICAIHCLLTPFLITTGAVLPASFLADESFHRVMLWVALPAGIVAFGMGCWRHRDRRVFLLGVMGIAGLLLSGTWAHDALGESAERLITVVSAAALVGAHVRNWQFCRARECVDDCAGA